MSTSRGLRARVDAIGNLLLGVDVTHPHPDHVAGLAELVPSDEVPSFATAAVADLMRRLEAPKREQWGPVYSARPPRSPATSAAVLRSPIIPSPGRAVPKPNGAAARAIVISTASPRYGSCLWPGREDP